MSNLAYNQHLLGARVVYNDPLNNNEKVGDIISLSVASDGNVLAYVAPQEPTRKILCFGLHQLRLVRRIS